MTRRQKNPDNHTIKTFKVYAFYAAMDDPNKFPRYSLSKTRKECLRGATSHHRHPCDDPLKRGVVATGELTLRIPPTVKITDALKEYAMLYLGTPAVFDPTDIKSYKEALNRVRGQLLVRLERLNKIEKQQMKTPKPTAPKKKAKTPTKNVTQSKPL